MKMTAQEILNELVDKDRIQDQEGRIGFSLGDVSLVVKQKDVVGNILQEWFGEWLRKKGAVFATSQNTQMPPDFFLDPSDRTRDMLEIKAFNAAATPAFDIADFKMYEQELMEKPYVLDVDYLIFGYRMSPAGIVTISDVWLKKVWQIARRMKNWPLNLQVKRHIVQKIRPCVWFNPPRGFYPFRNEWDFVSAIEETIGRNVDTRADYQTWRPRFLENSSKFYPDRPRPRIPRWPEIEDSYVV